MVTMELFYISTMKNKTTANGHRLQPCYAACPTVRLPWQPDPSRLVPCSLLRTDRSLVFLTLNELRGHPWIPSSRSRADGGLSNFVTLDSSIVVSHNNAVTRAIVVELTSELLSIL